MDHRRVTRIVYGVFIVGVGAFVASCIWQVASAVFRGGGAATQETARVEPACGEGIDELIAGVELALHGALEQDHLDEARSRYIRARDTKWSRRASIEATCEHDPHGKDALAAVARYDRAAEASVVAHASELVVVRNQAQSFISGHHR